jgi:hypothetical protein
MTTVFYIVLVFFSKQVDFHLGWFIVALLFSSNEARTIYKYTTDASLDGKKVTGQC